MIKITPLKNNNFKSKTIFCADTKSDEKMQLLKKAGFDNNETAFISTQSAEFINKLLQVIKFEYSTSRAIELAKLNDEDFQKMFDLLSKGVKSYDIPTFFKLENRERKKAQHLINNGDTCDFNFFSKLPDKAYFRVLQLLKYNVGQRIAGMLIELDDEIFQKVLFALQKGANHIDVWKFFASRDEEMQNELIELMKKGASFKDASNCVADKITKSEFQSYQNKGYDTETSAILANLCIEYLEGVKVDTIAHFIKTINDNSKKTPNFTDCLYDFLSNMCEKEQSLEEICEYVDEIDFKKLKQLAPFMNKYGNEQLLSFIEWHYNNATSEFNSESLAIQGDLTKILEEQYLSPSELNTLLLAHPLTKREVGKIPDDWFGKVQDKKQATKEIYSAINAFQKTHDTRMLSDELSKILNKKVKVESLGSGAYGIAYKILIDNAVTTCLKIFKNRYNTFEDVRHGRNIEPQTGLFLNTHSSGYTKMYFGKVATKYARDGFLVTQFLDEKTAPIKSEKINSDYFISYLDGSSKNKINGTIIDYGGTIVVRNF